MNNNLSQYSTHKKQAGMTLVELMITMVILAILTTYAVPSMKSLFERKSIFSIGDYFVKSIKFARVEAIQRGQSVTITPTSGTTDWSLGWQLQSVDVNGDPVIVRSFPAVSGSPTFTSDDFGGGLNTLVILPTGQVTSVGSFSLFYNECVGNQVLSFNILLSGLVQRGATACADIP